MWQVVRDLRDTGVTIILTTHYIEEAEEMADRVGVIAKGELILVEEKAELMRKLGKKQLVLQLQHAAGGDPGGARRAPAGAVAGRQRARPSPTTRRPSAPASRALLNDMRAAGIGFADLDDHRRARSRTSSSIS